ncbi:MAG TPA: hypothetical protein VJ160_04275 [Anaerolineales bacterium]|nr:hypothetical protein [Anaerolineales bacterium]
MNAYTLSPSELAVLVNHMTGGRLLEKAPSLAELRLDEQAWAKVEASLLDRGLLLSLPFEEASGVTSQLAYALSAALSPERVCVVRKVYEGHADPSVIFSFTPECITRNHVDAQGRHVFAELADREEAISAILSTAGESPTREAVTKRGTAKKGAATPRPRPVADLLKEARRLVLLLIVADPAEAAADATSLAWLETGEGLWLVDEESDGEAPQASPIAPAKLRQLVGSRLEGSPD